MGDENPKIFFILYSRELAEKVWTPLFTSFSVHIRAHVPSRAQERYNSKTWNEDLFFLWTALKVTYDINYYYHKKNLRIPPICIHTCNRGGEGVGGGLGGGGKNFWRWRGGGSQKWGKTIFSHIKWKMLPKNGKFWLKGGGEGKFGPRR